MKTRIAIFLAVEVFCALLAWLAGYDFNQRNPFVAFYTVLAAWVGGMAIAFFNIERKP